MTQKYIAVVAISEDNAIAEESGFPWETVEEDLRQYKHRVDGHPIVLGRKTYESLIKYDNRFIFDSPVAVLTTNEQYETEKEFHTAVHSREAALSWVDDRPEDVIYNLGGGRIYHLFMEDFDELVVSHMPVTSDNPTATFPEIESTMWTACSEECFEQFRLVRYRRNS